MTTTMNAAARLVELVRAEPEIAAELIANMVEAAEYDAVERAIDGMTEPHQAIAWRMVLVLEGL